MALPLPENNIVLKLNGGPSILIPGDIILDLVRNHAQWLLDPTSQAAKDEILVRTLIASVLRLRGDAMLKERFGKDAPKRPPRVDIVAWFTNILLGSMLHFLFKKPLSLDVTEARYEDGEPLYIVSRPGDRVIAPSATDPADLAPLATLDTPAPYTVADPDLAEPRALRDGNWESGDGELTG